MSLDPKTADNDEYESSQDSDFAPDNATEPVSDSVDSEDDGHGPTSERQRSDGGANVEEPDAHGNSGDEAIIEKGRKRQEKARAKADALHDDEGGEGSFIKTRRQRAAEKEERKYATNTGLVTVDVDAVWAEMLAGGTAETRRPEIATDREKTADGESRPAVADKEGSQIATVDDDESAMICIKRTYNFASRVHTEERLVPRDSAEAKLYLASQTQTWPSNGSPPAKKLTKKAFRSAFEPVMESLPSRVDLDLGLAARMKAAKEAQAKKLNTVEKSRMDWAGFVDKEGIKDELELASKSKDSYAMKRDFLARSEALRDSEARKVRLAGRT